MGINCVRLGLAVNKSGCRVVFNEEPKLNEMSDDMGKINKEAKKSTKRLFRKLDERSARLKAVQTLRKPTRCINCYPIGGIKYICGFMSNVMISIAVIDVRGSAYK